MLPKGHYLILNTEKRQIESIKNPSASIVSCLNTCSRSSLQNQANQQQMMTNRTFPVKEGSSHFFTFFFQYNCLPLLPFIYFKFLSAFVNRPFPFLKIIEKFCNKLIFIIRKKQTKTFNAGGGVSWKLILLKRRLNLTKTS